MAASTGFGSKSASSPVGEAPSFPSAPLLAVTSAPPVPPLPPIPPSPPMPPAPPFALARLFLRSSFGSGTSPVRAAATIVQRATRPSAAVSVSSALSRVATIVPRAVPSAPSSLLDMVNPTRASSKFAPSARTFGDSLSLALGSGVAVLTSTPLPSAGLPSFSFDNFATFGNPNDTVRSSASMVNDSGNTVSPPGELGAAMAYTPFNGNLLSGSTSCRNPAIHTSRIFESSP